MSLLSACSEPAQESLHPRASAASATAAQERSAQDAGSRDEPDATPPEGRDARVVRDALLVRHPECDPAEPARGGAEVPWEGFTIGSQRYTCNTCPGGLADLEGVWRLIDFETEDPAVALGGAWRQSLEFHGNTWTQLARYREGEVDLEARLGGWYWCSSKPEVANEAKVFVVNALSPVGALGYALDDVFTADLLSSTEGGDKLAFWFYEGFNTGAQLAEIYCRVGSLVTTLAGDVKPCDDPMEL